MKKKVKIIFQKLLNRLKCLPKWKISKKINIFTRFLSFFWKILHFPPFRNKMNLYYGAYFFSWFFYTCFISSFCFLVFRQFFVKFLHSFSFFKSFCFNFRWRSCDKLSWFKTKMRPKMISRICCHSLFMKSDCIANIKK